ncbi:SKP1-like protein 4 [Lycium ferocissimum]|uniref:SKP1-like protein 4 n=1 Tax=Lycium ferocissimum TaxID=112874 RepID=UPI0028162B96|nr:SKP1-like protein 4 [Lycium ferocissimum]
MASTSSTTTGDIKKMLTFIMGDNEEFYIEESLALQSELIKNMVKEERVSIIPMPTIIKREAFVKVIEYLKKHAETTITNEEFKNFEKEYVSVAFNELHDILFVANYLKIKSLMEICGTAIADKFKDKSPEVVKEMLGRCLELKTISPQKKNEGNSVDL